MPTVRYRSQPVGDVDLFYREAGPADAPAWGKNDAFFLPAGAEAYRRDIPDAEIHLLDAGHFALETHHSEIAALMLDFLNRRLPAA